MAEKVKAKKGTPQPKHTRYNEEFKRKLLGGIKPFAP
jgi:hypothetical protein